MIYESLIRLLPLAPVHPLRHCNTTIAKLLHKEKEDNIQLPSRFVTIHPSPRPSPWIKHPGSPCLSPLSTK
jgi:hypothetical protein